MIRARAAWSLLLLPLLALLLGVPHARAAEGPIRDYTFKDELLNDKLGKGPDLKKINGLVGDGKFTFAAGQGLDLEKAGVTDHYTIEVALRFDEVSSWRKILDFKSQASDNGLYAYNGQHQFYSHEPGGEFKAGETYRVRLQRDRGTKKVTGFLNGIVVTEFTDEAGDAVIENGRLMLLVDDTATTGEEGAGEITRLRIWGQPGAD